MDARTDRGGGLPHRVHRSGAWRAGRLSGDYQASSGPRDDYLELQLARGRFTVRHLKRASRPAPDVSIQRSDRGRRLIILRLTMPEQTTAERDWFGELVELIQPRLPRLIIDPPLAAPNLPDETNTTDRDVLDDPYLPLANSDPLWWEAAANAVEQARLRDAERLGLRARTAGADDATEFLDTLRVIRRGMKVVRRWPRDAHAHLALAQAYFLANAGTSATREAIEALRLDPSLGEAHALMGMEALYRGERERAVEAWNQATQLESSGDWLRALEAALAPSTDGELSNGAMPFKRNQGFWRNTIRPLLDRLSAR